MDIFRQTWAEIDVSAISYNATALQNLLPKGKKVMGVVKADGYGHGSVETVRALLHTGVDFLMVALLEEAVKLREAGIDTPIIVIGRIHPTFAPVAAAHHISVTVYQKEWIEAVAVMELPKPLNVHLEFETGMNRTGIGTKQDIQEIVREINQSDQLEIQGAYTHFATADDIDSSLYYSQRDRYQEMLQTLCDVYDGSLMTHMGNSAAGIQYPKDMMAYTRFGVSLYGMYPSTVVKDLGNVTLKPAMSLYSELMQVKKVTKGEVISYGGTYEAQEDEWIGTVPIGYADGWRRKLQGFHVLVDGKRCPIVGRICMDSMMIKLDQAYKVGTKVTLIGRDGKECITMDDVATHLDTICYEVPTMLTARVPKCYI